MNNQIKLITKEGFENLQKKLAKLEGKRPHAVNRLEHARSMGDLSENSEYHSAKEYLEFLDRQIGEMREVVIHSRIAQDQKGNCSQVLVGCRVKVATDNGKQVIFMIVGDHESDPFKGKISYSSPLGKALFEKRIGEKVIVKTPRGTTHYKIVAIN